MVAATDADGGGRRFIAFDNVSKIYNARYGQATALTQTSLTLNKSEFVCVVGPSGCGKTTLLNMLAGFVAPSTGSVQVNGVSVSEPGPERGVVFQEVGLFPWLTVQANVEFGLKMSGVARSERAQRARSVLSLIRMEKFANRYPNELSGGMKQRVGLARVLANDPQVLLMDEPFGALDAQTRRMMQDELLQVWQQTKKTVLFITHSVDEALLLGDRVIVMTASPGRIREDLRVDLPRPRDENSAEFNAMEKKIKDMVLAEAARIAENEYTRQR